MCFLCFGAFGHLCASLQTVCFGRWMADVSQGEPFRLLIQFSLSGETHVEHDLMWTDSFFFFLLSKALRWKFQVSDRILIINIQTLTVDKQTQSFSVLFCCSFVTTPVSLRSWCCLSLPVFNFTGQNALWGQAKQHKENTALRGTERTKHFLESVISRSGVS